MRFEFARSVKLRHAEHRLKNTSFIAVSPLSTQFCFSAIHVVFPSKFFFLKNRFI